MFDTDNFTYEQACTLVEEALEVVFVLIEAGFVEFAD